MGHELSVEGGPLTASAPAVLDRERWLSERRRWDRLAEAMPDLSGAPSTGYYRDCEIGLLRRECGPLAGARFLKLDLWNEAVNTRILEWVEGQGARTYGLDLSLGVVARARRNAGGGASRFVGADVRAIPFAADSFDFVYTMGTIEHIEESGLALAEIHRVLRPGGKAIVGVPHRWNVFLRPLLVSLLERIGCYPYSPERSFSAGALRREVQAAGLRVTRRTGLLTIPGALRLADLFFFTRGIPMYRVTGWLVRPFGHLERLWEWPRRFGYLVTLVAVKPAQ